MKVRQIKLGAIKPYEKNPRSNTRTVEALVKSIKRYGFNVPLVVDSDMVIVTGHARFKAATELGMSSVPCLVATHLSPDDAARYRLADNKIQELTRWHADTFIAELREIGAFGEVPGFTEKDKSFYEGMFSEAAEWKDKAPVKRKAVAGTVALPQGEEGQGEALPPNVGSGLGDPGTPQLKRRVLPEQVAKVREDLSRVYEGKGQAYTDSMITVTCKCCGKTFGVLRQDIERI